MRRRWREGSNQSFIGHLGNQFQGFVVVQTDKNERKSLLGLDDVNQGVGDLTDTKLEEYNGGQYNAEGNISQNNLI